MVCSCNPVKIHAWPAAARQREGIPQDVRGSDMETVKRSHSATTSHSVTLWLSFYDDRIGSVKSHANPLQYRKAVRGRGGAGRKKMSSTTPSENEWLIMEVLWESGTPLTASGIIEQLKGIKEVSPKTIRAYKQAFEKRDYWLFSGFP